jgi:hypothetical protein
MSFLSLSRRKCNNIAALEGSDLVGTFAYIGNGNRILVKCTENLQIGKHGADIYPVSPFDTTTETLLQVTHRLRLRYVACEVSFSIPVSASTNDGTGPRGLQNIISSTRPSTTAARHLKNHTNPKVTIIPRAAVEPHSPPAKSQVV